MAWDGKRSDTLPYRPLAGRKTQGVPDRKSLLSIHNKNIKIKTFHIKINIPKKIDIFVVKIFLYETQFFKDHDVDSFNVLPFYAHARVAQILAVLVPKVGITFDTISFFLFK